MSTSERIPADHVALTADIVSGYVSNNSVKVNELADLIGIVYRAVRSVGPMSGGIGEGQRPVPPVSIRKSVTNDYLISMEDGKQYKSLKRHLSGRGLTPEQYRLKWDLPSDYPMVAPAYAKQRSDLARSHGLGRSRPVQDETPAAAQADGPSTPSRTRLPRKAA